MNPCNRHFTARSLFSILFLFAVSGGSMSEAQTHDPRKIIDKINSEMKEKLTCKSQGISQSITFPPAYYEKFPATMTKGLNAWANQIVDAMNRLCADPVASLKMKSRKIGSVTIFRDFLEEKNNRMELVQYNSNSLPMIEIHQTSKALGDGPKPDLYSALYKVVTEPTGKELFLNKLSAMDAHRGKVTLPFSAEQKMKLTFLAANIGILKAGSMLMQFSEFGEILAKALTVSFADLIKKDKVSTEKTVHQAFAKLAPAHVKEIEKLKSAVYANIQKDKDSKQLSSVMTDELLTEGLDLYAKMPEKLEMMKGEMTNEQIVQALLIDANADASSSEGTFLHRLSEWSRLLVPKKKN